MSKKNLMIESVNLEKTLSTIYYPKLLSTSAGKIGIITVCFVYFYNETGNV